MKSHTVVVTALSLLDCMSGFTAGRSNAATPILDVGHISAYRAALLRSSDPEAQLIIDEIANGPADLNRAKAAALREAIPLTTNVPKLRPGENAAPLYDEWDVLRKPQDIGIPYYAEPMNLGYKYTPEQIAVVRQWIYGDKHTDQPMMEAIGKPILVPTFNSSALKPPYNTYRYYTMLREATRRLVTKGALLELEDQPMKAIDVQVKGFNIHRQIDKQPFLFEYLVSTTIDEMTMHALQDLLAHSAPSVQTAAAVSMAVASDTDEMAMKNGLRGEASWFLADFDQNERRFLLQQVNTESSVGSLTPDRTFVGQLVDATEARYLDTLRSAFEVADEPRSQRRAALVKRTNMFEARYGHIENDPVTALYGKPLDYSWVAENDDRRAARKSVLLAGAAVLRVAAKTGVLPNALLGNFIDPFSGKPLHYRLVGHGFVIYSVGPTGRFDGVNGHGLAGRETAFHYPAPVPTPVPASLIKRF